MAPASDSLNQTSNTVRVMDASGHVGTTLTERLLQRGYTVHATLQSYGESRLDELSCDKKNLKVFKLDPFDYQSILDALKGCSGLFYAFEPPQDQPIYDDVL